MNFDDLDFLSGDTPIFIVPNQKIPKLNLIITQPCRKKWGVVNIKLKIDKISRDCESLNS